MVLAVHTGTQVTFTFVYLAVYAATCFRTH
jgi:hypothetical protein